METEHTTTEQAEACVPRTSETSSRRSSYVFEAVSHLLDEHGDIRPLRVMRQEPVFSVPLDDASHSHMRAADVYNMRTERLSSTARHNSHITPHARRQLSLRPTPISTWISMGNLVGDDWPTADPPQADADADEVDYYEDEEGEEDEEASGNHDREDEEEGEEGVTMGNYYARSFYRRPLYTEHQDEIDGLEFQQQDHEDEEEDEEDEEEEYAYDEESSEGETVIRRQRIPEEWSREIDDYGELTDMILDRFGLLGLLMHCRFRKSGLYPRELDFLAAIADICNFTTAPDTTNSVQTWRAVNQLLPSLSQVDKLIFHHAHTATELAVCKLVLTMFETYYLKVDFPFFKVYTNDLMPLFVKFYETLSDDTIARVDSQLLLLLDPFMDSGMCNLCIFLSSRQDYLDYYRAQIRQYRNMVEGISLKSLIN
eukprot:GILJ01006300.1.p1 GENE.GILJ01006300.1~~GILJ01006300.1.p1  ORF type:complete len:427 (+),score=57.96 GILJ01006300.1:59-1339(+)